MSDFDFDDENDVTIGFDYMNLINSFFGGSRQDAAQVQMQQQMAVQQALAMEQQRQAAERQKLLMVGVLGVVGLGAVAMMMARK